MIGQRQQMNEKEKKILYKRKIHSPVSDPIYFYSFGRCVTDENTGCELCGYS